MIQSVTNCINMQKYEVLSYKDMIDSFKAQSIISKAPFVRYYSFDGGLIHPKQTNLSANIVNGCCIVATSPDNEYMAKTFSLDVSYYDINLLTSNRGELVAFYTAIEDIYESNPEDNSAFFVIGDSAYVLNSVSHLETWKNNGWKNNIGQMVSHKDLWKSIATMLEHLERKNIVIQLIKSAGHTGEYLNELADEAAFATGVFDHLESGGSFVEPLHKRIEKLLSNNCSTLDLFMSRKFGFELTAEKFNSVLNYTTYTYSK